MAGMIGSANVALTVPGVVAAPAPEAHAQDAMRTPSKTKNRLMTALLSDGLVVPAVGAGRLELRHRSLQSAVVEPCTGFVGRVGPDGWTVCVGRGFGDRPAAVMGGEQHDGHGQPNDRDHRDREQRTKVLAADTADDRWVRGGRGVAHGLSSWAPREGCPACDQQFRRRCADHPAGRLRRGCNAVTTRLPSRARAGSVARGRWLAFAWTSASLVRLRFSTMSAMSCWGAPSRERCW